MTGRAVYIVVIVGVFVLKFWRFGFLKDQMVEARVQRNCYLGNGLMLVDGYRALLGHFEHHLHPFSSILQLSRSSTVSV